MAQPTKDEPVQFMGGQYHRRRGSTSPEYPIIFSFPKNMNIDDLQDLTDLFEYKELTRKSKAN